MEAQAHCPSCGIEARGGARFCDGCGTPLQQRQQPAEYKQVTVLFADVVGSMDIAAALGPERLRELMTEVVTRAGAVVRRYDGTLNQFTGDGIMALFGAPKALEDHARRACLAALAIQGEIQGLAAEVDRRDSITLQLRIGLNSGMVVAGDIGSDAVKYTAIDEHVGMAQRMESAAPAGGVMLSESTARLVEDATRLSDPQLVRIKGAIEPVAARRLLAVGEDRRPRQRRLTTLVGRKGEMAAVETALNEAISRQGRVVGIKGPPGIGKSRITREASAAAERHGIEVISTFCESHSSQLPFHAAAGLLRGFFDDDALRDTAEALEIAEQWGDNFILTNAEFTYAMVLVRRDDDTDRELGFELLAKARRAALDHRYTIIAAWTHDLDVAAEKIRTGDFDAAIQLSRSVLDNELRSGESINRGWTTTVLVEALLHRAREGDLDDAQAAVDQLAAMPAEQGFLYHELPLLRLNALLARARGDDAAYRDLRDRYLARAEKFGMEGHIAIARAMT